MKEAIGGTMSITIIIVFLLLINGYLAFSVNYTKAFRVKNQVISLIEQHEGYEAAKDQINDYLRQVHYTEIPHEFINQVTRTDNNYHCENGYCVKCNVAGNVDRDDAYQGTYYSVITFVNINIPVINKILPLVNVFQVKGETKTIYSSGNNSELELCS